MTTAPSRQPAYFVSHGGGPYFWMDLPPPFRRDEAQQMRDHLEAILVDLPARPSAVVVVTAHWQTRVPTLNAAERPGMLYDYQGFPEHTYRLRYPAPGDPQLAERARDLLVRARIPSALVTDRDYDHGVFVPMLVIDPSASIPVVSMSICRDLDPSAHLAVGRALAPLRDENVLFVCSGSSFHNTRAIFDGIGDDRADVFDAWLTQAVEESDVSQRERRLVDWEAAPFARYAQPHEDHLIPLMVAAGIADADAGRLAFTDTMAGKRCSAYRFG